MQDYNIQAMIRNKIHYLLCILVFVYSSNSIFSQEFHKSIKLPSVEIDFLTFQKNWVQPNDILESQKSDRYIINFIPTISISIPVKSYEIGMRYDFFRYNYEFTAQPGDFDSEIDGLYTHNRLLLFYSKDIAGNDLRLSVSIASGVTFLTFNGIHGYGGGFNPNIQYQEYILDIKGIGVPIELGLSLKYPISNKLFVVLRPGIDFEKLFNYSDDYYSLNGTRLIPMIKLGLKYQSSN
jgi:hypothetical protein